MRARDVNALTVAHHDSAIRLGPERAQGRVEDARRGLAPADLGGERDGVEVRIEAEKGELCAQRLDAVRRIRAEPDAESPAAEGVEERHRLGVEMRPVPPGLLLDAQHLVE